MFDDFVCVGKLCYIGVLNFVGWQIMKLFVVVDWYGWLCYVVNQVYYLFVGCDYEWDLMLFGVDQGFGVLVWSLFGWGWFIGKIWCNVLLFEGSWLYEMVSYGLLVDDVCLYDVVDVFDVIVEEIGKMVL